MPKNFNFISCMLIVLIYANVSPQTIDPDKLKSDVSAWLNTTVLELKELSGGLTNASFVALTQKNKFVVRIGKQDASIFGIDRFCEAACQRSASKAGVAPDVLYADPNDGTLVSWFIEGETLSIDKQATDSQLKKIIQTLKKVHAIAYQEEFKSTSIYEKIRDMILQSLSNEYSFISKKDTEYAQNILTQIETYFQDKEKRYAGLCHCDLFPRNFIDDGSHLWLIDWEYACWGNVLFDLTSLCIELELSEKRTEYVLEAYFGDTWQQNILDFELMRTIFNLRNAFWYDIRGQELRFLAGIDMKDYSEKHFNLFKCEAEKLLPINPSAS